MHRFRFLRSLTGALCLVLFAGVAGLVTDAGAQDQRGAASVVECVDQALNAIKDKNYDALRALVPEHELEGFDSQAQPFLAASTLSEWEILEVENHKEGATVTIDWDLTLDAERFAENLLVQQKTAMEAAGLEGDELAAAVEEAREECAEIASDVSEMFNGKLARMEIGVDGDGRYYLGDLNPWDPDADMGEPVEWDPRSQYVEATIRLYIQAINARNLDRMTNMVAPAHRETLEANGANQIMLALTVHDFGVGSCEFEDTEDGSEVARATLWWETEFDNERCLELLHEKFVADKTAEGLEGEELDAAVAAAMEEARGVVAMVGAELRRNNQVAIVRLVDGCYYIENIAPDRGETTEPAPLDGGAESPEEAVTTFLEALKAKDMDRCYTVAGAQARSSWEDGLAAIMATIDVESWEIVSVEQADDDDLITVKVKWSAKLDRDAAADAMKGFFMRMLDELGLGEEERAAAEAGMEGQIGQAVEEARGQIERPEQLMRIIEVNGRYFIEDPFSE